MKRKIIEIDEERCTGCGNCILACAEGALELVDGKARLMGDIYCDGIGACIGECPEGALKIIEREAEAFDETEVERMLEERSHPNHDPDLSDEKLLACGCPGSLEMELKRPEKNLRGAILSRAQSELGHWPIKLKLLSPNAPFLKGADLVLLADCAAVAYPNLHRDFLCGRAVAIGCPKFDDSTRDIETLSSIIKEAGLNSLSIVHMEVPCCFKYMVVAEKALEEAGKDIDVTRVIVGRDGEILETDGVRSALTDKRVSK